jgi:hypothetical protein
MTTSPGTCAELVTFNLPVLEIDGPLPPPVSMRSFQSPHRRKPRGHVPAEGQTPQQDYLNNRQLASRRSCASKAARASSPLHAVRHRRPCFGPLSTVTALVRRDKQPFPHLYSSHPSS